MVRGRFLIKGFINLLAILCVLLFFTPNTYSLFIEYSGDILLLEILGSEESMPSGNILLNSRAILSRDLEGRLKGSANESKVLIITYHPSFLMGRIKTEDDTILAFNSAMNSMIDEIKSKANDAGIKNIVIINADSSCTTDNPSRAINITGRSSIIPQGKNKPGQNVKEEQGLNDFIFQYQELIDIISQYEELHKRQNEILIGLKKQLNQLRQLRQPDAIENPLGQGFAIPLGDRFRKVVEMPPSKEQKLVINGGFEDAMSGWIVGHALDLSKLNWDCQIVYDEDKESNVIQFERMASNASGSSIGVSQDVFIDLSQYDDVKLKLDVCPMYQSLSGGGLAGSEYPIMIQIAFIDEQNNHYVWTYGFLYDGETEYTNVTKIDQFRWFTYESPNLKDILPDSADEKRLADMIQWGQPYFEYKPPVKPKYITRVLVFGSGWDFKSRADNIEFALTPKL